MLYEVITRQAPCGAETYLLHRRGQLAGTAGRRLRRRGQAVAYLDGDPVRGTEDPGADHEDRHRVQPAGQLV